MQTTHVRNHRALGGNLVAFGEATADVGKGESIDGPAVFLPALDSQSIVVALVDSGQSIILMTTHDGGCTLNGEPIESGATHMAANGYYTLTLADGGWTVTFAPRSANVTLGISGENVVVRQVETRGRTLPDGTTSGPHAVT